MTRTASLLAVIFVCDVSLCLAAEPKIVDRPTYIVYVPAGIEQGRQYPLVVGLSPTADANSVIVTWRSVAERYKWIVYASKTFRNGGDMVAMLSSVVKSLNRVYMDVPVDRSKIIATGLSGGGMGSHALAFFYPHIFTAVVINTGMMQEYFIQQRYAYPRSRHAVFLASPTDFRYGEMKRDRTFLESLGWKVKWIEFKGGHTMAPTATYQEAAAWLTEQWH